MLREGGIKMGSSKVSVLQLTLCRDPHLPREKDLKSSISLAISPLKYSKHINR